jgi:hypothetical protein
MAKAVAVTGLAATAFPGLRGFIRTAIFRPRYFPGLGVWQIGVDGLQSGHARSVEARCKRRYEDRLAPAFAAK